MNSYKPLSLRQSVLLISAAILMSTTARAEEIDIKRLPPSYAGDGKVVGAKPNVFLLIANNRSMASETGTVTLNPNGNTLQLTTAALISALPQLEGKVRLGFTTPQPGYNSNGKGCAEYKLNGNVNRLSQLPGLSFLKEELAKNKKYVTGHEDFLFNQYGSGYGDTIPRDFRDNYASYIYSWLGGVCPASASNDSENNPSQSYYPYIEHGYPPYADLIGAYKPYKAPQRADFSTDDEYNKAKADYDDLVSKADAAKNHYKQAVPAGNSNNFPLTNFGGINKKLRNSAAPVADMYLKILGEVSDEPFLKSMLKPRQCDGSTCGVTHIGAERGATGNQALRYFPGSTVQHFTYDAYATAPDESSPEFNNGYPLKTPLSCRKNYTIMLSNGVIGPSKVLSNNSRVGVYGIDGYSWTMPNGREFPQNEKTRIYRHLALSESGLKKIPPSDHPEGGSKAAGNFMLSKIILRSYYSDLRSNLPDDVSPYYARATKRDSQARIPRFWNRKNDPATWQHMTFFALALGDDFPSWKNAQKIYNQYVYNQLPKDNKTREEFVERYFLENPSAPIEEKIPKEGFLESYFRAIEDNAIYKYNQPLYDWSRGGFVGENTPWGHYFYKNPTTDTKDSIRIGRDHIHHNNIAQAFRSLREMDYAKAGIVGRGGAYYVNDYDSVKRVIGSIANRIELAMAQGISGGTISSGRVTASQRSAGGNDNVLFTTYLNQEDASGNIFAFKNCPLIKQMIADPSGAGGFIINPDWTKHNCGKRLWNAASALYDGVDHIGAKTIIPVKKDDQLSGAIFNWDNLDQTLKGHLSKGDGGEKLGRARVDWLNGKLQSQLDAAVAGQFRTRGTIFIPDEQQRFKRNADGSLEKDSEGNVVLADPTNIPNLMGDVVYAAPKVVDNRGTLPAAHPLNNETYQEFLERNKDRKTLVLAGSNDGRLYGFSLAKTGQDINDSENAALAFSYIPRYVITKGGDDTLVSYTTEEGLSRIKDNKADGLVNGPFTVRDAQVNGQWGTYVVGTLGEGGDAIYALNISDGRASTNMFMWEVSDRGYGNIMAEPRIVWLRAPNSSESSEPKGKWVVILPTGYNAKTVSLVILDLADGREIAKINTTANFEKDSTGTAESNKDSKVCKLRPLSGTEDENAKLVWKKLNKIDDGKAHLTSGLTCNNGLGKLTVFDANSDSGADFVFAGDLFGHVWKFDLRNALDATGQFQPADKFTVAYESPLFIAQTGKVNEKDISTRQPITSMITIDDGAYGEGSMLYFGTGRMFNPKERGLEQQESFYGIWDIPRYTEQKNISDSTFELPLLRHEIKDEAEAKYTFIHYEAFVIDDPKKDDLNKYSLRNDFKELRGVKRVDRLKSSEYLSIDLSGTRNSGGKVVGWVIDFPSKNALERVIERAYSFEDNIYFSTFTPQGSGKVEEESCSPLQPSVGGEARFYMVNRETGGQIETSPFDFNHDGTQDEKDGVEVPIKSLSNNHHSLEDLGYSNEHMKCDDNNDCKLTLSPAGILLSGGGGDFLSVIGVLERSKQATNQYDCDYSRQVVFPSTVDPNSGNPLVLTSCNRNRYRVWKQPVIE